MNLPIFTVLVADDVAALRNLIRIGIESSGRFKVVGEAGTGTLAIAKAAELQPDIVLLDLSMPEMDGLQALPRVLEAAPHSRVAVLSGFNHVRMAPVAQRLGASAYFEKGVEPEELVQRLLDILEPPTPANGDAPAGGGPPSVPPGPPLAPALRVLVVESDPHTALRLAGLLTHAPGRFSPVAANSLQQAQEALGKGGIDLLLVDPADAGAPAEDLFVDLLSRAPSLPLVALVPGADGALAGQALRLGVEDCLPLDTLDPALLSRSLLYATERRRGHAVRGRLRDQEDELRRLRELEHMKTEFFNAAAHELGTPLTPLRIQIGLLKNRRKDSIDEAERKSIQILDRNVERLAQLNRQLLDVARIQAGHLKMEVQQTDLHGLMEEVADSLEPVALANGIAFMHACPENEWVDADPTRLGQVLYNLVGNALKFTPPGGRVSLSCEPGAEESTVRVQDTGIGLRPDQIARLFQPFTQVLGQEQPAGVGSGLGLFVCRGIVELHGGRIWCESPGPGQGSTFAFTIRHHTDLGHAAG
jgi:signal transduction histidine kinase